MCAAVEAWKVHFTLPEGQQMYTYWGATAEGNTVGEVTFISTVFNGALDVGNSAYFRYAVRGAESTPVSALSCTPA
ncbi:MULTISPECIES: cellulose binding domain-containing protein [Streptomyces]|uniref:cellulose binding domain-containing protein n=1 Tax=Streptomyces TaxID=1883 RepID=UPI0022779620|nr:cellulose binding domain-containing protein [Streptomyces sp. GMR22]